MLLQQIGNKELDIMFGMWYRQIERRIICPDHNLTPQKKPFIYCLIMQLEKGSVYELATSWLTEIFILMFARTEKIYLHIALFTRTLILENSLP